MQTSGSWNSLSILSVFLTTEAGVDLLKLLFSFTDACSIELSYAGS